MCNFLLQFTKEKIIVSGRDAEKARKDHGLTNLNKDVFVEGYSRPINQGSVIVKSPDSRKGTAYHEVFNSAWDLVLNAKEKAAMRHYFEPKAEHRNKTATELMADGYKAWKEARKRRQGTIFGKLYQKIYDFLNAAHVFFTGVENVHNIYRKIENGDVWKRDAQGRFSGDGKDTNYKINVDVNVNDLYQPADLRGMVDKIGDTTDTEAGQRAVIAYIKKVLTNTNISVTSQDLRLNYGFDHVDKGNRVHIAKARSTKGFRNQENRIARNVVLSNFEDVLKCSILVEIDNFPLLKNGFYANKKHQHHVHGLVRAVMPVILPGNKLRTLVITADNRSGQLHKDRIAVSLYELSTRKIKPRPAYLLSTQAGLNQQNYFADLTLAEVLSKVKGLDGEFYVDPLTGKLNIETDPAKRFSVAPNATAANYSVRPERVSKVDDIQAGMKQPQDNKGKKPHITVEEKVRTDSQKFGMLDTVLHSPSYVAEKYARFRGFFRLGAKAMDKQEYLRNKFDRHLKRMLDPLQTKEEKKLWNEILYYR